MLRKLRQFQELGHTAVLIIGDFTAQVGDPSGKSATRPRLSKDEVEDVRHHLRRAGAAGSSSTDRLEIRRNSEWLGAMGIEDVLRLTAAHHRRPHARARRLLPPLPRRRRRSR